MRHRIAAILITTLFAAGCQSTGPAQTGDVVKAEQDFARKASATIAAAQEQVALAQDVVNVYQTKLAALPADSKERPKAEKALAKAQGEMVKAQLILSLAKLGADLLAAPAVNAVAATQPAK